MFASESRQNSLITRYCCGILSLGSFPAQTLLWIRARTSLGRVCDGKFGLRAVNLVAFLSCLLAVWALNEVNSHMVVSAQGYRDVDAPAEY